MGSVLGWGKEKTLVAASPWGLFLSFHQMGYETYLSTVLLSCLLSCFLRPTSRRDTENRTSVVESNEARQKFAGAKAISSDMFFGREADAEVNALCSALTSFPVCSGCSLFRSFTFFLCFPFFCSTKQDPDCSSSQAAALSVLQTCSERLRMRTQVC